MAKKPEPKVTPVLSAEDKARLRASTADQMAEFDATNAAAAHAVRNFPIARAEVGKRLECPIDLRITCPTCGGLFTEAICPTDGTKLHE